MSSLITCTVCGVEFMSRGFGQLYCSSACAKERWKRSAGADARRDAKVVERQAKVAAKVAAKDAALQLREDTRNSSLLTQRQDREKAEALRLHEEEGGLTDLDRLRDLAEYLEQMRQ